MLYQTPWESWRCRAGKSPGLKVSSRRMMLSPTLLLPTTSTGPKYAILPGSA